MPKDAEKESPVSEEEENKSEVKSAPQEESKSKQSE
jgi:hypothetical protein